MALVVITIACLLVLGLYGRSVASTTRHALGELLRYLALVLGILFIAAMLLLLTLNA